MSTRYRVNDLVDIEAIPPPRRPTALFGMYTAFGYGHLARGQRLARAFAARTGFDAYVFGHHPSFRLDGLPETVHEVDLPGPVVLHSREPLDDLPGPAQTRGLTPAMSIAELSAHKSRLLLGLARRLQPCVIVIDHFPFSTNTGRDVAECAATLEYLRDALPQTLRCASYRGLYTLKYGAAQETCRPLVERYLDLLIVCVDPREAAQFYDAHPFLRPVEARIRFVGYVAPPPAEPGCRTMAGSRILATFGAGVDAYRKIRLVCDAFRILTAARSDLTLDVLTGEGLPEGAFREIETLYGDPPRLRILRFVPALATRLAEYDLIIAMAGYNACVELYQARTRAIVLPRISPRSDQVVLARKFHAHGGIDHVVDSGATSPEAFAQLLDLTLQAPPSPRKPLDLGGANATAALLHAELRQRAGAP